MSTANDRDWPLWPLAIIAGLLPLLSSFLWTYIAMKTGEISSCFPFLEGCASVSATGRYPPASYIFRGIVLPYTGLLALYWFLNGVWVRAISPERRSTSHWMTRIGVAGSVCLIVYAVLLGSHGEAYEFMRRFGVYFYFLFTVIAQLLLVLCYRPALPSVRTYANLQLAFCIAMFASGLVNLVAKQLLADPDRLENIVEWNFLLAMMLNLTFVAAGWRATNFRYHLSAGTA